MRKLFFICCLLVFACSANVARAENAAEKPPPLRAAVDAPFPPFAMFNDKGELVGFDVDIARAICRELKRDCEVRAMVFENIIPAVASGEIDMGVAGLVATEERKTQVDFTDRYFRSLSIFIQRGRALRDYSPASLKGLRVGVQVGTVQELHLRENYGADIVLMTTPSYEDLFSALREGKADVILATGLAGFAFLKSEAGAGCDLLGDPLSLGSAADWACIAVSKNDPALRLKINEAIQALRRNGEYGKINRKYFDFNIY